MAMSPARGSRRRSAKRGPTASVGFPPELRRRVEAWAAAQDPALTFPEAARRLVETALDAAPATTSDAIPVSRLNASNDS